MGRTICCHNRIRFGVDCRKIGLVILLLVPTSVLAQVPALNSRGAAGSTQREPPRADHAGSRDNPVGQAVFVSPAPGYAAPSTSSEWIMDTNAVNQGFAPMTSPSRPRVDVLRSDDTAARPGNNWGQQHAKNWIEASPFKTSLHRSYQAKRQVAGPTVPQLAERPVWKTPYAYGYFGASAKKHWSKSHRYKDRDTQWTLR